MTDRPDPLRAGLTGNQPPSVPRFRAVRESISAKSAALLAREVDHNGRPVAEPPEDEQEQEPAPRFQGGADQGSANREKVRVPDALEAAEGRGDWDAARRIKSARLVENTEEMDR